MNIYKSRLLSFIIVSLYGLVIINQASGEDLMLSPNVQAQIKSIMAEKALRSDAESKIESNLLQAKKALDAQATSRNNLQSQTQSTQAFIKSNVAADETVKIIIHAEVTPDLLAALEAAGALEVTAFAQYQQITARLPVSILTTISSRVDVKSIEPFLPPLLNRYDMTPDEMNARQKKYLVSNDSLGPITNSGSVTSEGVVAHAADKVHQTGITGQGQKVCVLSDGVDSLSTSKNTGDLPSVVDIVPGQAGNGDEGTAMLEIVYDMAPGASLGFASGFTGEAQMATNIATLDTTYLCSVIVDDVTYFAEPAFQEGIIANAVTTASNHGKPYFSSAANSGNLLSGTSGTWEGDFFDYGSGFNSFGGFNNNQITGRGNYYILSWSDPQNAALNDYDLYIFNAAGTSVLASSTNSQNGYNNPLEFISGATIPLGARIAVVKYSGSTRALRLDTVRGQLYINTNGNTFGHNAGINTITMAAVDVASAGGGVFTGGTANPVESFSSDGPRRLFYNPVPATTAITPGNVLFNTNGGTLLNKVDFTAADGVSTTVPLLNPFFGTSAAAPNAAAIAALVKSAKPTLTLSELKNALIAGSLDIGPMGNAVTTGSGVIRADLAVKSVLSPVSIIKSFSPSSVAVNSNSRLSISLTNPNQIALQGISLTDNYPAGVNNASVPNASLSGSGCQGSLVAIANGSLISISSVIIPAGATCLLEVNVNSTSAGVYTDSSGQLTTPIGLNSAGVSSTLTIAAKTDQTINFGTAPSVSVNGTGTVSATATSGLAINYTSATSSVCTVSGTTVTGINAGSCEILANQTGNGIYNAAPQATQTFDVKKKQKPVVFSISPSSVKVGGSVALKASGGSGKGVIRYTISQTTGSAVCNISANKVIATGGSGTCTLITNKAGDATYNSATSAPKILTVNKANQAKLTLKASPTVIKVGGTSTLSTSGGTGSGVVSYSVSSPIGKSSCTVTGNQLLITGVKGGCKVKALKEADQAYNAAVSAVVSVKAN